MPACGSLGQRGLIPLVDVRLVTEYQHLLYTTELITALVINESGMAGFEVSEEVLGRFSIGQWCVVRMDPGQ